MKLTPDTQQEISAEKQFVFTFECKKKKCCKKYKKHGINCKKCPKI